ncbi:NADH-quinone oxidoreductase subunit G [Rhodoferax sp. 4810]|uniref:NADH-quinone oxidoreductase n=1 Tax=Thiospirillum jenense TaxID=1653858 RepID=A0A839HLE4_9GAMM|nr:NADH-quinone oxidoreductase subunit NuoG [Thiospirillum jenense]MBB1074303.1 NADH-quinone oxidoreductase subunit G [Rhodoferax jenense]MBB1126492.1 NADH-quinone oxidoreductase subunit G [Thiospirillum jenense]
MSDKITIEIDGRSCEAAAGEMIIAVADREGIPIPRFCYHPKLSVAANCRMCLVEAEQNGRPFPKPVPACATPVGTGLKVWTRSAKALDAQRSTMEFLLINHPLDCPICDQGGECELQDVAVGYGGDVSRYSEAKRVVVDEDLGALIATCMTRCIHCTRCVRFIAEIAGTRELGATGRSDHMRIGTFVATGIAHELSGNIIDLCPVGALTAKPSQFKARAWELTAHDSIAPHDAVGAKIQLHVRRGQVIRVHPRCDEAINENWLADRERFSYEGLTSVARLTHPRLKRDGVWHDVSWDVALQQVAAVFNTVPGDDLGVLLSPQSTLEELYLAQRLFRAHGCPNIDSRLRQQDFRGDAVDVVPWLGLPIADLEQQTAVLVIGSDLRQEQPLLAHRLRKAALHGATIALVNPYQVNLTHPNHQFVAAPQQLLTELAAIAAALGGRGAGEIANLIAQATPTDAHQTVANALKTAGESQHGRILLGALAAADPNYVAFKALAYLIAEVSGCGVGYLPPAANSVGVYFAGALPHVTAGNQPAATVGLNTAAMLSNPRRAYFLWGFEPDNDLIDPTAARKALNAAEFVVIGTAFTSPALEAVADVLLPIAAYAETAGTLVNAAGTWQRFQGAVAPPGEARPGWKVLRVLGNAFNCDGFNYQSAKDVHDELLTNCGECELTTAPQGEYSPLVTRPDPIELTRIGAVPIYAVDSLVRHADSLQQTPLAIPFQAGLHPDEARRRGLNTGDQVRIQQGDAVMTTTVVIDTTVAIGTIRIPAGIIDSEQLGAQIGAVSFSRV